MSHSRIVYRPWTADPGRDPIVRPGRKRRSGTLGPAFPGWPAAIANCPGDDGNGSWTAETPNAIARQEVAEALECLSDLERDFIRRFYYMGLTYRQISERTGRAKHKLEAIHKRALGKMKQRLAAFARERYGIDDSASVKMGRFCPICVSPHRAEIDRLMANRDPTDTWRPVISILRQRYGVEIRSPQTLMGHERYHGNMESETVSDREFTVEVTKESRKTRGQHNLSISVSYELKLRLKALARKYDRPTADMVRAILRIGIPMMEGLSQAEEVMVREYVDLFRRLRQVRTLKDV